MGDGDFMGSTSEGAVSPLGEYNWMDRYSYGGGYGYTPTSSSGLGFSNSALMSNLPGITSGIAGIWDAYNNYKSLKKTIAMNRHKIKNADIANQNARDRSKSVDRQLAGKTWKRSGRDYDVGL